jgi:hypothetical protein
MGAPLSKLNRLLAVFPALLLLTFANVFIGFSTAGVVLIQLLASGTNKYLALTTAVIVAIGVHVYIAYNHKLRNFIENNGENK